MHFIAALTYCIVYHNKFLYLYQLYGIHVSLTEIDYTQCLVFVHT